MLIRIILLTLLSISTLTGCASKGSAYIKAIGDNVYFFDKTKKISVSTTNSSSMYAQNMVDSVKAELSKQGYFLSSGDDNSYILSISMAESSGERTSLTTARSHSNYSGSYGNELISIHGTEYRQIPIKQAFKINGFTFVLYDASEQMNPFPIWKGMVLAENNLIKGKELSAFSQLVSSLGQSDDRYIALSKNLISSIDSVTTQPTYFSPFFSVKDTLINETLGEYRGSKSSGYIKTRKIKTQRFDGFVQTVGLDKYNALSSEQDELPGLSIGLGAYSVFEDGVYTTFYNKGDLRKLDEQSLTKVFSLPLKTGEKTKTRGPAGSTFTFHVKENAPVKTLAGDFQNCFSIHQYITYQSGNTEGPTISWLCEGAGIVKQELSTGRTEQLTNQIYIVR
jgi:hypothetical protein